MVVKFNVPQLKSVLLKKVCLRGVGTKTQFSKFNNLTGHQLQPDRCTYPQIVLIIRICFI